MTDDSGPFFDAIASRYDRVYALSPADSRRRMTRVLRELPPAPARVLDLGVGTGRELSALLDAGYAPTGLDASAPMLERCARRARPVPLVRADFWRTPLPFEDQSFDAVVALHGTLAHPPDGGAVARLARELGRLVPSGGVFLAEVPSIGWLEALGGSAAATDVDRVVHRTGARTCRFEDRTVGARIDARLLDEAEWHEALAPLWRARIETLEDFEWRVVARRV
jgi:SAM-dependent methyltransferase